MSEILGNIMKQRMLGIIQHQAEKKIQDYIQKKKWQQLFSKSGENIIRYMDKEGEFTEELKEIFSKDNMEVIAEKTEKIPGFSFPAKLHDELYSLLKKYGTDDEIIETYIRYFSEQIIHYIQDNDQDKNLEIYLGQWRDYLDNRLNHIEGQIIDLKNILKQDGAIIENIQDIEEDLKQRAYYNIDLSFFELDDDAFKLRFERAIRQKQEMILIEGKSNEETLYRILNEIKQTFPQNKTFIIRNRAGWERIEKLGVADCILIPTCNFENAVSIPGNICIYIYNEEFSCRDSKKIILRKRTRRNLVESLEKAGISQDEADHLARDTHGFYASLKHKLFRNPPSTQLPLWVSECSDVILSALLLGKWTNREGDREAFRIMTGKDYKECFQELKKYGHFETPLIIQTERFGGSYFQIASIEDSWELLGSHIDNELWKRFLDLVIIILSRKEQKDVVSLGFREEILAEIKSNDYSGILYSGILRTLMLCSCFTEEANKQYQIKYVVTTILDSLSNQADWNIMAKWLPDLCEAAPEPVMKKLEKELISSTGMLELFYTQSGYVDILWAAELLVQQETYRIRTIEWLWKIFSLDIEYKNGNTPQDLLKRIFCAWYNTTGLNYIDKGWEAEKAISKYDKAWYVISSCLPDRIGSIITPVYSSKYREIDEPQAATIGEANKLFYAYLKMCIETAGKDIDKWQIIIKALPNYEIAIQEEILPKLIKATTNMDDNDKTSIKLLLRNIIYHHRRYDHSDWAMQEEGTQLFEDTYNSIIVEDPIYDYLYIFTPVHSYPLLHPISYDAETDFHSDIDYEEQQIEEEIDRKVQEFNEKRFQFTKLIEYASTLWERKENRIGYVVAQYFDHGEFDKQHFETLLQQSKIDNRQIYEYTRIVSKGSLQVLGTALAMAKQNHGNNELICDLISLQKIDTINDCLIFHESEEIKKTFWGGSPAFQVSPEVEPEVLHEALCQCLEYGSVESYTELLNNWKRQLTDDEIYNYALKIENIRDIGNVSSASWNIENLLEVLQKQYIDDEEKSYHIARLEWICGDLIHWDQMRCFQKWIRKNPRIYAYLLEIVCRKDNEEEPDPVKAERASKLYRRYHDIHFCPADNNGSVKYDELKQWVDDFRGQLQKQDQASIFDVVIGELFSYSPIDEDGFVPCKAVCQLIEENYTDTLENSYVTTEFNKRGVYSPDAGRGETQLANTYRQNAEKLLQNGYPHTAQIYYSISEVYSKMADKERKYAEDEN